MQHQLLGLIPIDSVFVETDLTLPNPPSSSSSSSPSPSSSSIPSSSSMPMSSSSAGGPPMPSSAPISSTVPLSGAVQPAGTTMASFAATTTLPQVTSGWDIQVQVDLVQQPTAGRQTIRVDLEGPSGLLESQELTHGKGCLRAMTDPFATPNVTALTVLTLYFRSLDGTQLLWEAQVEVIPASP